MANPAVSSAVSARAPEAPSLPRRTAVTLSMTRAALIAGFVVGVNCMVVAGVAAGRRGIVGAAIGFGIVVAFSLPGLLLLHAFRRQPAGVQMTAALMSYTARVALFAIILVTLPDVDSFASRTAIGLSAIAVLLGWVAGEIWGYLYARTPTYDLDEQNAGQGSAA